MKNMKLTKTKYQLRIFTMYDNHPVLVQDFVIALVTKKYFLFIRTHKTQWYVKLINELFNFQTYSQLTKSKLQRRLKRYEM